MSRKLFVKRREVGESKTKNDRQGESRDVVVGVTLGDERGVFVQGATILPGKGGGERGNGVAKI